MSKEKLEIPPSPGWLIVIVVFLLSTLAYSQSLLVGVKVAGQISNTFTYPGPEEFHEDRVLAGPFGEVRLGHGLSLEMDALYRRRWFVAPIACYFNTQEPFSQIVATGEDRFHSWELPLILLGEFLKSLRR